MKIAETVAAIFQWKENQKNLVFMIKSQGTVKDFPGYYGFPWGRLNKREEKATPLAALVRRVKVLLGYDLESAVQSGQVKQIKPITAAVTLEIPPLCFSILHSLCLENV